MRKLIVILLCLPLFLFSQEEREYDKTMSISQFVRELENAANKGTFSVAIENWDKDTNVISNKIEGSATVAKD